MIIRWKLILTLVAIFVFLVACAVTVAGDKKDSERIEEVRKRLKQLRAVPYSFVSRDKADSTVVGVTVHDEDRAWEGYNLYCGLTRQEAVLMDMDGYAVHRWTYPAKDTTYIWNHAILLADGDVVVIRRYHDLIRLDWHSNMLWRADIKAHHDVIQNSDGNFYVVVDEIATHRGMQIPFPAIACLSPGGTELSRWRSITSLDDLRRKFDARLFVDTMLDSLLVEAGAISPEEAEALMDSIAAHVMYLKRGPDQFHMNTVSILPDTPVGKRDARFRAGNFLICFRNLNQIAVLDQDTWEVLWAWGADDLDWPHLPIMVEGGHILVFDNGTHRMYSRVIELDPITGKIEWEYVADPPRAFFTPTRGSAQRLPNGNTLVCDGNNGRTFEITTDGEIVWEWFNPVFKEGHRGQVYRMWRIAPEVVEPLLEKYATRGALTVKTLGVLGVFILLVTALLFNVLIGDDILLTDNPYLYKPWNHYADEEDLTRKAGRVDSFRLFLPWRVELSRAILAGRLPFWSPDVYGGTPFLADPQARALYPPSILLALADPLDAMGYDIAIHILIALIGMYLFLRVTVTRSGAMIGAVAYGLSSCFFAYMVHPTVIGSAAWLPFYFYAFERARRHAVSGTLLLAGFLTLGYLGCHPQVYLLTVAGLALYATYTAVESLATGMPRRAFSDLKILGLAGFLALLVAAIQLVPFLELMGNSTGLSGEGLPPLRTFHTNPLLLVSTVFPNLFGNPVEGTRWIGALPIGGHHYSGSLLAYCGAGGILAAICSVFFVRRSRHIRAMLLLLAVTLCLAISSPLLRAVNSLSPLPGSAGLGRFFVLICFGIAALAGMGYSAMSSPGHERSRRRALFLVASIVILVLVMFATLVVSGQTVLARMVEAVQGTIGEIAEDNASTVFLSWLRSEPEKWLKYETRQVGMGLALAAISLILLVLNSGRLARSKRFRSGLAVAFLVILAIDLGLAARSYYVSQPRNSVFETEGIARLEEAVGREGRWRIMNLDGKRGVLTTNTNLIFGISSLQGNYRLKPAGISDVVLIRRGGRKLGSVKIDKASDFDNSVPSLMSVRFMPAWALPPALLASPVLRAIGRESDLVGGLGLVRAGEEERLAFCQRGGDSLTVDVRLPAARWLDFAVAVWTEGGGGCDSVVVSVACETDAGNTELVGRFDLTADAGRWHCMRMDMSKAGTGRGRVLLRSRQRGAALDSKVHVAWSQLEFVTGDCGTTPTDRGYEVALSHEKQPVSLEIASSAAEVPLEVFEDGRQGPTRWVDFSGPGDLRHITLARGDVPASRIHLESDSSFTITACKSVRAGREWIPGFELWHDNDMLVFENLLAVEKGICVTRASVTMIEENGRRICHLNDIENLAGVECGECSIVSYEPERVDLAVTAREDSYLIFQDTYFPGWEARIDGRPAEIMMTSHGVRAIEIAAGRHDVIFEFKPDSFRLGLVLTLLGLILGVLYAWKGRRPGSPPTKP